MSDIRKLCFKRLNNNLNNDKFSKCKEYTKCSFFINYDGISCLPIDKLLFIVNIYNLKNINNKIIIDNTYINDKKYITNLLIDKLGEDQLDWINILDNKDIKNYYTYFLPIISDNKYVWLNTININEVLKRYEIVYPCFKFLGAVPCDHNFQYFKIDNLIKNGKTKFAIIYNTDDSKGPGQHWVAIYCNIDTNEIFYYDSTGNKPQEEFKLMINNIKKQLINLNNNKNNIIYKYNKNKHQYKGSECGVFSIFFIIRCLKNQNIDDIFNNLMNIKDDEVNKIRDLIFIFEDKKNIDYLKYYNF